MTAEEYNIALQSIRDARDIILKDTDWTQVQDSPVDKLAWAEYRQTLRDLPSMVNEENIDGFEFPIPPGG